MLAIAANFQLLIQLRISIPVFDKQQPASATAAKTRATHFEIIITGSVWVRGNLRRGHALLNGHCIYAIADDQDQYRAFAPSDVMSLRYAWSILKSLPMVFALLNAPSILLRLLWCMHDVQLSSLTF